MNDIEIYTLPVCPYCNKAKKLLQSLNLEYKEHDISDDPETMREELKNKFNLPQRATVPQITVNGHYVGGYTDLESMYKSGKLDEILNH